MLYYDRNHTSNRSAKDLLAAVETFLQFAVPESRPPVYARISQSKHVQPGDRHVEEWADALWLKPGYGTQKRVDAVMEKIRRHIDEPHTHFAVRWIPNFAGPQSNSFDILGIDHAMRTEGGNYAHFIALAASNTPSESSGNAVMMCLVLPYELESPEYHSLMDHANRKGSFKLAASALRVFERTKTGGFKRRKI